MVNIYAEFDDNHEEHQKCIAYLKDNPNKYCYDWVIFKLNYCPMDKE